MKSGSARTGWPLHHVLIVCALCAMGAAYVSYQLKPEPEPANAVLINSCSSSMHEIKIRDYKLVKPLLLTDVQEENPKFNFLKQQILQFIDSERSNGGLEMASVYLRDLNDGSWMNINPDELYDPGSIMKLPILIAYLKKSQDKPGFLDKKLHYKAPVRTPYTQQIKSATITPGKDYSIRELLRYMIVESDNEANYLLNRNIEPSYVYKIFSDLGLTVPDNNPDFVIMKPVDVSKFMRVLFNAGYLGPELSEFALELLSQTKFNNGILKGVPDSITVAHKFGERGYTNSDLQQLHETGIIFFNDHPVLLTIMTRGKNQELQSEVIGTISLQCFEWITKNLASI